MFQHSVSSEKILKVQADKRRAARVNASFSGAISENGEFLCHCVIKDVSNTGMRIQIQDNIELPDEFDVKTPAVSEIMNVTKQWQHGRNFGVTFKVKQS